MCGGSLRLLVSCNRRSKIAHDASVVGAASAAQAMEEGDEGRWADARLMGREAGGPERLKRDGSSEGMGRKPRRLQKLFSDLNKLLYSNFQRF
jgi:hypothetical protein